MEGMVERIGETIGKNEVLKKVREDPASIDWAKGSTGTFTFLEKEKNRKRECPESIVEAKRKKNSADELMKARNRKCLELYLEAAAMYARVFLEASGDQRVSEWESIVHLARHTEKLGKEYGDSGISSTANVLIVALLRKILEKTLSNTDGEGKTAEKQTQEPGNLRKAVEINKEIVERKKTKERVFPWISVDEREIGLRDTVAAIFVFLEKKVKPAV
ncbi:MAG: uncharacterized protein A8A55_2250 [Amphiamblys sp. WSBS2006]|nr:MAG: uncharacterized protein A8A55_2250 [Amphiamblys sp. WSBS2006]